MNRDQIKKFIIQTFAGFGSLALAIIFYFFMLRFDEFSGIIGKLLKILTPFVYGGVIAYLLKTPCKFFEDIYSKRLPAKMKKNASAFSVLTVILLSLAAVYLLLAAILPQLITSIVALTNALPDQIEALTQWLRKVSAGNVVVENYVNTTVENFGKMFHQWTETDLIPMLEGVVGGFANTVTSIVGFASNVLIGVIIAIYLLLGRKTFAKQSKAVIYSIFKQNHADMIIDEFSYIDRVFVGFFAGKILDSAIVGLICYVFCLILTFTSGFTNAMLISVIVGVTNIIPYFGPFIGAVPSALLVLMSSPMNCLIFLIFIIILQQFDGNILGPKLLAGSVGLSGFWVLFSITLFGGIFGFAGVLAGVPVFAVIYSALKNLVLQGLKKKGKTDILKD